MLKAFLCLLWKTIKQARKFAAIRTFPHSGNSSDTIHCDCCHCERHAVLLWSPKFSPKSFAIIHKWSFPLWLEDVFLECHLERKKEKRKKWNKK